MAADVVRITHRGRVNIRFQADDVHLLVAYQHAIRSDGESRLGSVQTSSLKDMTRKLTFVPSGHAFSEWYDLRDLPHMTFFYIESDCMHGLVDSTNDTPSPQLFFEDVFLWETVSKLSAAVEGFDRDSNYLDALGTLLVHEMARLQIPNRVPKRSVRGGLAGWQQRVVVDHIETHLSENLQLSALADLVRLSSQHFCRAFKQSVGHPPLRYHGLRRIERAKQLLAQSSTTVTEIGLALGYSETSSFTTAFRRATGLTPSAYRRGLV